mmetsp:Transcript_5433/g.20734  ORF Transcript_5433/g.20734 Transcript_5433/m.20734 type:complete len:378 (+) Transcript_5433:1202-2335(+)
MFFISPRSYRNEELQTSPRYPCIRCLSAIRDQRTRPSDGSQQDGRHEHARYARLDDRRRSAQDRQGSQEDHPEARRHQEPGHARHDHDLPGQGRGAAGQGQGRRQGDVHRREGGRRHRRHRDRSRKVGREDEVPPDGSAQTPNPADPGRPGRAGHPAARLGAGPGSRPARHPGVALLRPDRGRDHAQRHRQARAGHHHQRHDAGPGAAIPRRRRGGDPRHQQAARDHRHSLARPARAQRPGRCARRHLPRHPPRRDLHLPLQAAAVRNLLVPQPRRAAGGGGVLRAAHRRARQARPLPVRPRLHRRHLRLDRHPAAAGAGQSEEGGRLLQLPPGDHAAVLRSAAQRTRRQSARCAVGRAHGVGQDAHGTHRLQRWWR